MQSFSLDKATEILENEGREAQFAYCMQYADGDQKNPDALACLGQFYHNAEEPERDLEKAEAYYREAALVGSKVGQALLFMLGCQYMYVNVSVSDNKTHISLEEEMDFPLDLNKAECILKLYDTADQNEYSWAIPYLYLWLGGYYRDGWNGIERDRKKALELVRPVADSQDKDIQLAYADYMFNCGEDTEAYKSYQRSANQGYAPAMLKLAEFVKTSRCFFSQLSFKCLRKAHLPFLLGFILMLIGSINNTTLARVVSNPDTIFTDVALAAISAIQLPDWVDNVNKILLPIGYTLIFGTILYVLISIYRSAAKEIRKHVLFAELYLLVSIHLTSFLSSILEKAGFLSQYTADISIVIYCGITLAIMFTSFYRRGAKLSFEWIQKAAATGDIKGINKLAERYFYGIGVKKNREKAVSLYKLASSKGSTKAKLELGHAHRFGRGVQKDYDKAYQYYMEVAEAGNANGQYMVGYCYENAIGVLHNMDEAVAWYRRGKANGCRLAHKRLNRPLKPSLWDHIKRRTPSYSERENELLRKENAKKDETIRILHEQIITGMDSLKKSIDTLSAKLETTWLEMKELVEAESKAINENIDNASEALLKKFTEYCTIIQEETENKARDESNEHLYAEAEGALKSKFGSTWAKLDYDSRIALISSRVLLAMVKGSEMRSMFDYSGIAISASSALENELIEHFYQRSRRILDAGKIPYKNWPACIKKNHFALGDFLHFIVGDKDDGPKAYENRDMCLREIIKPQYIDPQKPVIDCIVSPISGQKSSFYDQCDDIRLKYRNPAAHAETVSKAKALSCCERIMGQYDAENQLDSTESVLILLFELIK